MPNIEDFEKPEELLQAAVETIRQNNGVKGYILPKEASDQQEEALIRELQARHPWHKIIVASYVGTEPRPGGGCRPAPKTEETHTLDELREMIEPF